MFEIGTGSLLSNDDLKNGKIPRVSAKSDENGILGYFNTENLEKARHFENFISVNFFGVDGGIFYHPYKASVEMKVHTLKIPNINFNLYNATFIIGVLKKILKGFGYGEQLSSSKLKNLNFFIKLPIKNKKIDFEFMEKFIKELENAKLKKLKEYLKENNLDDFTLTQKEKEALEKFEKVEWREFRIGDLFEVSGTKSLDSNAVDFVKSGINFIGRTFENNGIQGQIKRQKFAPNEPFTITATVIGNYKYVKYQKKEYYCSQNINKLKPKKLSKWNSYIAYYFVTHIQKFVSLYDGQQNGYKLAEIKNHKISLPTKNDKIDFEFMENFILGLEKLIVRKIIPLIKETNEP